MNHSPQVALPQGMTRRDVIAVISEIGPDLNLSGAAIFVLTKLIGSTSEKDWIEPGADPTFYGTQETMAERLQMTARQLRSHERNFERKNILKRDTKANGAREAGTGRGLLFTPLKACFADLLALRDQKRAVTKRIKELKSLRSVRLRRMKEAIARLAPEALEDEAVASVLARFDAWPRSDRLHSLGLDRLEVHVEATAKLCMELEEIIENLPNSSCEPAETFRSFIQEDNQQILLYPVTLAWMKGARASPRTLDSLDRGLPAPIFAEKISVKRIAVLSTPNLRRFLNRSSFSSSHRPTSR
ncbi:helix-turn-helix domain-containing protein [Sulfitobacter pontiacus]